MEPLAHNRAGRDPLTFISWLPEAQCGPWIKAPCQLPLLQVRKVGCSWEIWDGDHRNSPVRRWLSAVGEGPAPSCLGNEVCGGAPLSPSSCLWTPAAAAAFLCPKASCANCMSFAIPRAGRSDGSGCPWELSSASDPPGGTWVPSGGMTSKSPSSTELQSLRHSSGSWWHFLCCFSHFPPPHPTTRCPVDSPPCQILRIQILASKSSSRSPLSARMTRRKGRQMVKPVLVMTALKGSPRVVRKLRGLSLEGKGYLCFAVAVQLISHVWLFATPRTATGQAWHSRPS